jgi:hypothetical protein
MSKHDGEQADGAVWQPRFWVGDVIGGNGSGDILPERRVSGGGGGRSSAHQRRQMEAVGDDATPAGTGMLLGYEASADQAA